MQHQSVKVALAHKIKQTNPQQQQKAPLRQAISKYQPTWQGLLSQKQKNVLQRHEPIIKTGLRPDVAVNLYSIFCERRATIMDL